MILVADSGSSNTDWIIIENNKIISSFSTKGFNPYFTSSEKISSDLKLEIPKDINIDTISKVYFYGSGCSTTEMKNIVKTGLVNFFQNPAIEVYHDLIGAARALFHNEIGIVVILGTGANTCFYNGNEITKNIPSLGYILGDEGGGDYLGKLFITELLYENIPEIVSSNFYKQYKHSKSQIMQKVYKESHPNQFLASICKFIFEYRSNEFVNSIITKSFTDLFEKHITKYDDYQNQNIRIAGSVGYYFQDDLQKIAKEFNTKIDLFEKKPINRLAQYHLKYK
ncbi:ATPase [Bacteroidota bacterium]